MTRALILTLTLLCASAAWADDGKTPTFLLYSFDEPDGTTIRDSGPLKADGTLSTLPPTAVEDAGFTAGPADQWQPILRNGVQLRNIKERSEHLLLDTEAPIVFDRNADYAIDYPRGRIKPLGGGRMRAEQRVSVGLTYSNAGPARVAGRQGRALEFNGLDAFVDCGEPDLPAAVDALTVDLWFQLPADANGSAVLLTKGDGVSVGFDKGALVFRHEGLKTADGKAADATRAAEALAPAPGQWRHLTAAFADGVVTLKLDDREVARSPKLAPQPLAFAGPLRIGGAVEPVFYKGVLDDVRIAFRGRPQ